MITELQMDKKKGVFLIIMLYFVCAIWEELLHSFLWILHVPFSADSVSGVMVKYMRSSPF